MSETRRFANSHIHRFSPVCHLPAIVILSFCLIGWIGDGSRLIHRGNEHYTAGEYDAAVQAYQAVLAQRPKDAIAHYNLGTALYKKKQFDEAANAFRSSLNGSDAILQAKGYYNLGNAQFQLGHLHGAIRSYKSALRLNPTDQDAKYNLELGLEKLAGQQGQSNNQGSDADNQDNQPPHQSEGEGGGRNADESEPESMTTPSEAAPPSPEENTMPQRDKMSKEEAIRLLEAFNYDDKKIQQRLLRKRFARRQKPEKDW